MHCVYEPRDTNPLSYLHRSPRGRRRFRLGAEAFTRRAEHSLAWQKLFRLLAQGLYIRKEQREISLLIDDALGRYLRFQKTFLSLAAFRDVEERVPQHMIASYLGMTPETLSRVRRELRKGS